MSVHVQPANWSPSAGYREFMGELPLPPIPMTPQAIYITGWDFNQNCFLLEGPGWKRIAPPSALQQLADHVDPSRHLNLILCLADAPCTD